MRLMLVFGRFTAFGKLDPAVGASAVLVALEQLSVMRGKCSVAVLMDTAVSECEVVCIYMWL